MIARRGALESLRDRMTIVVSLLFAIGLPTLIVNTVVRIQVALSGPGDEAALGQALAIYFLMLGLAPTTGAVGIACGQFAGEKEAGSLAPLLASPASNFAIFGGKILAAVLPTLVFAAVAEIVFLINLLVVIGVAGVALLPANLSLAMLALVPAMAIFSATIASLVSSRVRTFNTAQQISGLVLAPFTALLAGVAFNLPRLGTVGLFAIVVGFFALDLLLTTLAARTWRREEVLAGR
jgi:ABC-type Na+ efflux pump permease subunit